MTSVRNTVATAALSLAIVATGCSDVAFSSLLIADTLALVV